MPSRSQILLAIHSAIDWHSAVMRLSILKPALRPEAGLGHEWRGNTETYWLAAIHRGEARRLQDGLGFIEQEF